MFVEEGDPRPLGPCRIICLEVTFVRIAQVTPVYPPYRGGMARVAFEYTERLRQRGHDVEVFSPRVRAGNAGFLPSLPSALASFDVVHLHYPFYGGAEPVAHARSSRRIRSLVVTYHMDATATGVKGAAFDAHREMIQPWVLSHADALLVSSLDYAAASALARVDRALRGVTVSPFGVDLERFHPGTETALRASLGIDAAAPVILFVGSLDAAHRFKGIDLLFSAVTNLRDLSWHMAIVGDGADRPRIEREVARRQLASHVVFAGDVNDDSLPSYYRLADIHVLPSSSRAEAFGLVTLEAAATALPSIVPDLPGVRTNVVDGTTGVIVPANDAGALEAALRDLVSCRERCERLGRDARRRVERDCQWGPLIDQLEAIYRHVVNS